MLGRGFELFILIIAALLLFGYRRLPGAVRQLGKATRILKSEVRAMNDDVPLPEPRTIRARPDEVSEKPQP